jgi:hypothetical protein
MQILFIDESGTPPPARTAAEVGFFVLGGVVIPEEVWVKLAADLKRIKIAYSVVGELKWRYFAPDKGGRSTSISHLDAATKEALRSDLYKALTAYRAVKIISVVTNAAAAYAKGYVDSPEKMYWLAYKQLTERFQYYLQDLSRLIGHSVHGIVVCDNRGPKDDENLRNLHATLMNSKTENVSHYQNVIEGLFIAPSHLSVGIQFADLVAGAIFRHFKAKDDRFYRQIAGSLRTSPTGSVDGFGIVKFPKATW